MQSFLPTINKPTRVTDISISATLIDNIITNANLSNVISSIIYFDISDHFPIFLQTDVPLKPIKQPRVLFKRRFTNANKVKFVTLIEQSNWSSFIGNLDDVNVSYDSFANKFGLIFNECFLLVKLNMTRKNTPRKPWMTARILNSSQKKNAYIKLIKTPMYC